MAPTIVELEKSAETIDAAALLLSECYKNDPILRFDFGCEYKDRPDYWIAAHKAFLNMNFEHGVIYAIMKDDGNLAALACCYLPGQDLPKDVEQRGEAWSHYRSLMEPEQVEWDLAFDEQEEKEYAKISGPNFLRDSLLLRDLVVDEEYRTHGYGSALIEHCVRKAAENKATVALQTSREVNCRYYQKRGFIVRAVFPLRHPKMGTLTRWLLDRPYQPDTAPVANQQ